MNKLNLLFPAMLVALLFCLPKLNENKHMEHEMLDKGDMIGRDILFYIAFPGVCIAGCVLAYHIFWYLFRKGVQIVKEPYDKK